MGIGGKVNVISQWMPQSEMAAVIGPDGRLTANKYTCADIIIR